MQMGFVYLCAMAERDVELLCDVVCAKTVTELSLFQLARRPSYIVRHENIR